MRILAILFFILTLLPGVSALSAVIALSLQSLSPEISRVFLGVAQILLNSAGILVLCMSLPFYLETVPEKERLNWAIIFFFFNAIAIPIFVYRYIVKPTLQPRAESEVPVASSPGSRGDATSPDEDRPGHLPESGG